MLLSRRTTTTMVALLLATGCTASQTAAPTAVEEPRPRVFELGGGAQLLAPAGAFDEDVAVDTVPAAALPTDITGLPSAGVLDVQVSAQPSQPVEVEIPVAAAAFSGLPTTVDGSVLVLHQHDGEPVEPLVGRLDRGRSVVTVTTDRLSVFDVRLPSLAALRDEIAKIGNGFLGSVDVRAAAPVCDREGAAREAGYTVDSTSFPVLQWCLGMSPKGVPQLRVVANRRYPLLATHGRSLALRANTGGEIPVALGQALTTALGKGRQVTLSPGGTAVFDVALAQGDRTSLQAEFDGLAQSLVSLQMAADLLITIAGKMPFSKPTAKSGREALAVLEAAECVPKLLDLAADPSDQERVGAMVQACLQDEMLAGVSGAVLKVLGGVVALIGSTVAYFLTSASALVDQVKGQSSYTITVRRAAAPAPTRAPVAPLPPSCDRDDVVDMAVCEFVRAALTGDTRRVSADEKQLLEEVTDLPRRDWDLESCELEGDVTVLCRVAFPVDEPGTEPAVASFHLQPTNGEYDGDGGLTVPEGEELDYDVISYDGLGV